MNEIFFYTTRVTGMMTKMTEIFFCMTRVTKKMTKMMEIFFCMTTVTKSIPLSLSDGEQKWGKSGKMDYRRPNQDKLLEKFQLRARNLFMKSR